jgi:type 1 glutamine amidotransferase
MQIPSIDRRTCLGLLAAGVAAAALTFTGSVTRAENAQSATKRIVLLAGRPSHPPGMHEFRAGSLLLQKALSGVPGVTVEVIPMGWPTKMVDGKPTDDNTPLQNADAILVYADGGRGNPAIQGDRIAFLESLAAKGVGLGFAHYGVEVPVGPGGDAFHRWIGGFYEDRFSVNPMWAPAFDVRANHPVTRGVQSFSNTDEWYFNMRWSTDPAVSARVTPILTAKPSDDVRDGPYVSPRGPYPHIVADSGKTETIMWTYERPNGGRGFGFTGGHTHANWGDPNQRRVVANALLWIAKAEVPAGGVVDTITAADLTQNLDDKTRR